MVWQKILGRIGSKSTRSPRKRRQRRLRMERMERREVLASNLGAIAGVAFVDQAGDGSPVGDPPVLIDGDNNLVAPGTPGAQGITVQLFEDTNNDSLFDPDDDLVGTDVTDMDGNYRFDRLTVGRYFLEQQPVGGLDVPVAIPIDVTVANGIQTALIDDYSATTQTVSDPPPALMDPFDSAVASEAIGGNRDIQVTRTSAVGQVSIFVDNGAGTVSIGSQGLATGTGLIQYDGGDDSLTLDANGLGGISLSGVPGAPVDLEAGLIVLTSAQVAGNDLFIQVFSDDSNSSTATIPVTVPPVGEPFVETLVRFTNFVPALGAGADFTSVGAIEVSVGLSADNDVTVSIAETRRPNVLEVNVANVLPITLGGQLFIDNDPGGGQNNGLREGTEPGVDGVTVELYSLANPDDVVDPVNSVAVTFTTTGVGGVYSFPGLDPGHYAVVVPSMMFQNGAALSGFANSTGNDPATDPDDNIDDDDDGTMLASDDVISGTITLESNAEPTDDDDTDPNTNTTVDFGFFPQIDLSITKSVNVAASNIIAGGNVVFDFVVGNDGPRDATDVVVEDVFPAGLMFSGTQNESGSFTTNVNGTTVELTIPTIPAGTSASFQFTADIGDNQTDDITNTATVTGTEVDIDPGNNSDDAMLDLVSTDLRIEKNDMTDPVNAGNQLTYQIVVTNDGPDDAAGVVVVDTLPGGVTFVSGDVDGASNLVAADPVSGEVTATVGTLANDASSTITIVVAVDDNADSPLTNSAVVTADPNTDPDPTNNSTTEDTAVDRVVDVEVTKTVSGTPVAGTDITYTVVVRNDGPSQARDIVVTDTLDSDLTLVVGSFDAGSTGVTLSDSGQDLTFDVGTLNASTEVTFTFDVSIAASATDMIPNTATVTTSDNDDDNTNDSSTVEITVEQQVDLILQKDVDLTTAVPGQDDELVYTFTISHDSDSVSDATNVVMTDVLPAGLTGAVISAPNATSTDFSNGTVTVEFDSIPVGMTETFTVTVDIDDDATGTVVNPASVASDGTELDDTNNRDDASTVMMPDFDVVVSKAVDDATPGPTDTVTYTIGLENEGPSTAPNVILSDTIPAGLTFVSGTLNGQAATSDGTTVSFPAITIAPGDTETATLQFTVNASANGTITNTASVPDLSADGENDTGNNSASADITVTPQADLEITKSVSADEAQVGAEVTYTIDVTNNGPSQATNVQVADTLPAGVTFVSGIGPNGEALSDSGGVVNVNGGTLDDQGSFSFTIVGMIATGATGNQTNSATVSSDTNDADSTNNTATATTAVDPRSSTIAGFVFLDLNNDGIQDPNEVGIEGVEVRLTGMDSLGNEINRTVMTDSNGLYQFLNLAQGVYSVEQTQPLGFRDGIDTQGTGIDSPATVGDDMFTQIGLGSDQDAVDFNFAERNERLSKRRFLASS